MSQARSFCSISRSQSAPPGISRSSQRSTAPCLIAGLQIASYKRQPLDLALGRVLRLVGVGVADDDERLSGLGRHGGFRRDYDHPREFARSQGGFPSFTRDNAAVLDLADACLSPNHGADEAFLRPRGRSCRAWPRCDCVRRGAGGVDGQSRIRPGMVKTMGEPTGSRPTAKAIIQHCLAQIGILCYSE